MGNIATTLDEQLIKLKNRGLEIDVSDDKAKEVLSDIGYYRLGFYWHYFEIDDDHNFVDGAKFSDIIALYYLDVDLRHTLIKYLNRLEVNFRTNLIYIVSNKYKMSPTWFGDRNVVKNDFIMTLNQFYNEKFKSYNKSIKDHHSKYINDIYAPAWKTLEFMSFGFNLKLYRSIKDISVKKEISKKYNVFKLSKFVNHMKAFISLRNICAHGSTLYDYKPHIGISFIPIMNIKNNERYKLSGALKLLSYYIGVISKNRQIEFDNEVKDIIMNPFFSKELRTIIETKSGYK